MIKKTKCIKTKQEKTIIPNPQHQVILHKNEIDYYYEYKIMIESTFQQILYYTILPVLLAQSTIFYQTLPMIITFSEILPTQQVTASILFPNYQII